MMVATSRAAVTRTEAATAATAGATTAAAFAEAWANVAARAAATAAAVTMATFVAVRRRRVGGGAHVAHACELPIRGTVRLGAGTFIILIPAGALPLPTHVCSDVFHTLENYFGDFPDVFFAGSAVSILVLVGSW